MTAVKTEVEVALVCWIWGKEGRVGVEMTLTVITVSSFLCKKD